MESNRDTRMSVSSRRLIGYVKQVIYIPPKLELWIQLKPAWMQALLACRNVRIALPMMLSNYKLYAIYTNNSPMMLGC